jgi:RNA polymerase sigma-70 factor (ECF subfamily)
VELYSFDDAYLSRLRAGDAVVQQHFVSYFGQLLLIKLRARALRQDVIEDIRQETFARVLAAIRRPDGIRAPDRLGAFVNTVCNNVLLEQYRASSRSEGLDDCPEPPDMAIDLDGALVSAEACRSVKQVLAALPEKDRKLLQAVFLEEQDKDQICRELGVDRDYLRVLLHRAKAQFRSQYEKSRGAAENAR